MIGLRKPTTIVASAVLALAVAIGGPAGAASAAGPNGNNGGKDIVSTTENYLTTFYPIWFTHFQTQILPVPSNEMIGPEKISPVYQAVVAINDDTLYASSPIDVRGGEVVVEVPATPAGYSVLLLDAWGSVYPPEITSKPAGDDKPTMTYSLVPAGYSGPVTGQQTVELPLDQMILIFRTDKYSNGIDMTGEAETFRKTLSVDGVPTAVKAVEEFGVPVKTTADTLVRVAPIDFLQQIQTAVASDWTPALSQKDQKLPDDFDALFGDGTSLTDAERQQFAQGAHSAHDAIIANYLDTRGSTNWTHFTNIGEWKKKVLDRASITEFCQYCNTSETAAYYHAFYDASGAELDGANADGYVLTFPADAIPEASRFWSLTAYTPEAVQPIPNPIDKYLVASYTPGLETNPDGSISIYIAQTQYNTDYQITPDAGSVNPWIDASEDYDDTYTITLDPDPVGTGCSGGGPGAHASAPVDGETYDYDVLPLQVTGTGYPPTETADAEAAPALMQGDFFGDAGDGSVPRASNACAYVGADLTPCSTPLMFVAPTAAAQNSVWSNPVAGYLASGFIPAPGEVYVFRGKAPRTPQGASPVPWNDNQPAEYDMRYFSLCLDKKVWPYPAQDANWSCANGSFGSGVYDAESNPDGLTRLVPDADGYWTVIVSSADLSDSDQVGDATVLRVEAGVPAAMIMRHMVVADGFTTAVPDVPRDGAWTSAYGTLQEYYPVNSVVCSIGQFEARGWDEGGCFVPNVQG